MLTCRKESAELLCCLQDSSLEDAIQNAGGVPDALVTAFTLLLQNQALDPAFIAAAISPPAAPELIDANPEADPVTIHHIQYDPHIGNFSSAPHKRCQPLQDD